MVLAVSNYRCECCGEIFPYPCTVHEKECFARQEEEKRMNELFLKGVPAGELVDFDRLARGMSWQEGGTMNPEWLRVIIRKLKGVTCRHMVSLGYGCKGPLWRQVFGLTPEGEFIFFSKINGLEKVKWHSVSDVREA